MKDLQAGHEDVLEKQTGCQHGIQGNEGDEVGIFIGNYCCILGERWGPWTRIAEVKGEWVQEIFQRQNQ